MGLDSLKADKKTKITQSNLQGKPQEGFQKETKELPNSKLISSEWKFAKQQRFDEINQIEKLLWRTLSFYWISSANLVKAYWETWLDYL